MQNMRVFEFPPNENCNRFVSLLFLYGTFEYCRFLFYHQLMTNAAREGARYGVANVTDTTVIADTQTKITNVMAIGACSFFAPTAPATAIAPDTPHTAPPAPMVAARRRSRPSFTAVK